ncbi:MAG: SMP-30/gluconolactonase/LRE family protein [Spirochaetes bacterium]|nr:SMP-30/gluconolactonase/LRE family protein [Spirochaetota bacterium]
MKKKIVIVTCVVLILVIILVIKSLRDAGEFTTLTPRSVCTCARVMNVPGAEDIAIDHETGIAFVSSFDRRAFMKGKLLQGAIYSYNLQGKPVLKNVTAGLTIDFYPHGISFFKDGGGRKYLFAINHHRSNNYIEIFEIKNNTLVHLETVGGELMISPNDVTAVGPRQFYFTNDHGSLSTFGKLLEDILRYSRSNVAYFDGKKIRIVADGFGYANGIWADNDGKRIYVTASTDKRFYIYHCSPDGSLNRVSVLHLGTGGDNIDIDGSGVIRVAAHPKMLTFLSHARNDQNKAPSQILEITRKDNSGYAFKEIYLNLGEEISAASVAAVHGKRLLVGSVFEDYFLDCTMN